MRVNGCNMITSRQLSVEDTYTDNTHTETAFAKMLYPIIEAIEDHE